MIWGVQNCVDCGKMSHKVCQHKNRHGITYQCNDCYEIAQQPTKDEVKCKICMDSRKCNHV